MIDDEEPRAMTIDSSEVREAVISRVSDPWNVPDTYGVASTVEAREVMAFWVKYPGWST